MKRNWIALPLLVALAGCAGSVAIQPDRAVFALDSNYQRYAFPFPIEEAFDRTVATFKESGYKLDVVDRATGQISGTRGKVAAQDGNTDKGMKFYALVMPDKDNGSQLGIKIIQTIEGGIPVVKQTKTEIIVTEPQMYQYIFRRIENATPVTPVKPVYAPKPQ